MGIKAFWTDAPQSAHHCHFKIRGVSVSFISVRTSEGFFDDLDLCPAFFSRLSARLMDFSRLKDF